MYSLDELIAVLSAFPLKNRNLNENSALNESINLFGSLMLQRVRSLLAEYFPESDLEGITKNSSLGEILMILNRNHGSNSSNNNYKKPLNNHYFGKNSSYIQPVQHTNATTNQVVSVGIDIETIVAFPSDIMLPSGRAFRSRTFCPREIAYASTKHSPIQTLLGIFCAKEAVIKCCIDDKRLTFRDVEIEHDSKGRPVCNVRDYVGFKFKVSISHTSEYSCAFALMEHSYS